MKQFGGFCDNNTNERSIGINLGDDNTIVERSNEYLRNMRIYIFIMKWF